MEARRLVGKAALVTGAGSGIGAGIAGGNVRLQHQRLGGGQFGIVQGHDGGRLETPGIGLAVVGQPAVVGPAGRRSPRVGASGSTNVTRPVVAITIGSPSQLPPDVQRGGPRRPGRGG